MECGVNTEHSITPFYFQTKLLYLHKSIGNFERDIAANI